MSSNNTQNWPKMIRIREDVKITWITNTHYTTPNSKGAKWTIFYNITVSLQYCWDKTITRSGDMYRDASGIFSLVIKRFGNTNTSVQKFPLLKLPKCLRKLKVFFNKFNIDVSSLLMSSLRAIVICPNYCGNRVISSRIHLFAPLLCMRRCTLWNKRLPLKWIHTPFWSRIDNKYWTCAHFGI